MSYFASLSKNDWAKIAILANPLALVGYDYVARELK